MLDRITRGCTPVLRACMTTALLAGASFSAAATDYITVRDRYGLHTVLGKEPAIRVGNAAIVRMLAHHQRDRETTALHFLAACDGSWMTAPFAGLSVPAEKPDFAAAERRSIADMPAVIAASHQFALQDNDPHEVGPILKKHIRRLCASARPAPDNFLVPVGETDEFDGLKLVYSMVAKPEQVKGDRVRAWLRTTFYTKADTPGVQTGSEAPTGEYWMKLKEFDCKKRQAADIEEIVHGGAHPGRSVCKTCNPTMIPLKEYSMGDAERKMACRLFGKSRYDLPL